MGTVPEHHSNTPLRCEKGTTCDEVQARQAMPVLFDKVNKGGNMQQRNLVLIYYSL